MMLDTFASSVSFEKGANGEDYGGAVTVRIEGLGKRRFDNLGAFVEAYTQALMFAALRITSKDRPECLSLEEPALKTSVAIPMVQFVRPNGKTRPGYVVVSAPPEELEVIMARFGEYHGAGFLFGCEFIQLRNQWAVFCYDRNMVDRFVAVVKTQEEIGGVVVGWLTNNPIVNGRPE